MKRNNIIIYLTSKGILLKKEQSIYKENLESVDSNKIINSEKFINEFQILQEKYNINKNLLSDNIFYIIDSTYNEIDKIIILDIFKNLYYKNIYFIDIKDIFEIKDKELIININKSNIKIYVQNKTYSFNIYFNEEIDILKIYLSKIKNVKKIRIYGEYSNIEELEKKITDITKIKCYHYTYNDLMPLCEMKEYLAK